MSTGFVKTTTTTTKWHAPQLLPTAAHFYQPDVPSVHPLLSHVSNRGPANYISPALSQLCTLVSGVAQNFATLCELIRHIFSSFWEDRKRVMSWHLRHSRGLVQQRLYTPSISDKCQYPDFRSSLLMRGHILDVPNICTGFIRYEGPFIHSSRQRGQGWDRMGYIHDSLGLADWRRELNKFFLLGTLLNKSFLTSPMNTLPASLID